MGEFIFKFLKELNSATSSKSLVLAIILGLIAGFLPSVNLFTFLIFFIVLIFRIPTGLFIASFGVFKIIGSFLDPIFDKVGYLALTNNVLEPIWTFLYNLPLFRWSGFNNTIVMGSLIVGVVISVILYFVLLRVIKIYRKVVFEKLKNIKYLSWLVPEEKKGIIRISGVLFVAGSLILVSLFFIFLLDPIIKYSLEFSLSKITHKKVTIQKVDTSLKDLSINIENMQIDTFLLSKVYTQFDLNKLIWRKYKIDDLIVDAQTNKNIYDFLKIKTAKTKNSKNFNFNIKIPKPDIFATQQLKSIKALEKLKLDYKKVQNDLKNINLNEYKDKFNYLQKEVNSLKNFKVKSPDDLQALLEKVNDIKNKTNNLVKEIKEEKKVLQEDKKLIQDDLNNLKIALNEDKKNIKSKYEMIKNKEYLKFSETFLKPEITKYINLMAVIYQKIKPYLSTKETKEYKRKKGVYITFEDKIKYPDFALINSDVNLKTSVAKWHIKANNITDNQVLFNKKAEINFNGKSKFFDVGGEIKYLKKVEFSLYGKKVEIKKLDLELFVLKSLADIDIKGELYKNNIDSKILISFYNPSFKPKSLDILKNLNKIKHFKVIVLVKGDINSPIIKINSDLDRYLSEIIKEEINKEVEKNYKNAKKKLEYKINSSLENMNLKEIDIKLKDLNSLEDIDKLLNKKLNKIIENKKKSIMKNTINKLFSF